MINLPKYHPDDFGKVAVLMGGTSAERHISLASGRAILEALHACDIDATAMDMHKDVFRQLVDQCFRRVFIALHGRGGEDGKIQGALDLIGLPYTGSGVLGSSLAMDKYISKSIWRDAGLLTPDAVMINASTDWSAVVQRLGLPMMIKPVNEGSSFGATKVSTLKQLPVAWRHAYQFDHKVMAERWVDGEEYTIPILNDTVLPIIKLETEREFYDFKAKYEDHNTRYICPCGLPSETEKSLGQLAKKACDLITVAGWGRVDSIVDEAGREWLIEVNTIPGMTQHSLLPMAAKQAGISFQQLVIQILATSLTEETTRKGLTS